MLRSFILLIIISLFFSSCKYLNPTLMLRTKRNYQFDELPQVRDMQDRLQISDRLAIRVLSNDGFSLIDVVGGVGKTLRDATIEVEIDFEGNIKLPVIGRVNVLGLTHREAEDKLEKIFSDHIKEPFVMLNVTSNRVFVFPGMNITGFNMANGLGTARVVELKNSNTTLFEVIAETGGVFGKSWKIKLIREKYNEKPLVYLFDLSKIDGLKYASFIVQSGDIIYVDPVERPIPTIINEISPYLALISTTLSIYFTAQTLRVLIENQEE